MKAINKTWVLNLLKAITLKTSVFVIKGEKNKGDSNSSLINYTIIRIGFVC